MERKLKFSKGPTLTLSNKPLTSNKDASERKLFIDRSPNLPCFKLTITPKVRPGT